MSSRYHIAICKEGLSEGWLGGLNYFRNLLTVFDASADSDLTLHFFSDDLSFVETLNLSNRIVFHRLRIMQRKTLAWAARKTIQLIAGGDLVLIRELKKAGVSAVMFSEVVGASKNGIGSFPWIPDFQFKHHPELFPASTVNAEQKRAERCVDQSDGLIVSSNAAKRDAIDLFHASPDRVYVLHFAPKLDLAQLTSATNRDEVFTRYGINQPYFFLPNQYWHHKNHKLIVDALVKIKGDGLGVPLVISTGMTRDLRDESHFDRFKLYLEASGLDESYRILGVIPRQDMLVLLAHSLAVINPSRFEGWSTTVEEGKALGKSLLVSNIDVHREQVAGNSDAWLFEPDDSTEVANLMLAAHKVAAGPCDFPPSPRPEIYEGFLVEYVRLLQRAAASKIKRKVP